MSEAEPLAESRRWMRFAREDMRAAEALRQQGRGAPRHVCWLAQQAAEKGLKAALVFLQIDFPRSHDLDALRNLLPEEWRVRSVCADLADLTEWAVEARYPSDWPEATQADAGAAMEKAAAVLDSIAEDLRRRGVDLDQNV